MSRNKLVDRTLRKTGFALSALALAITGASVQAASQCYTFDNIEVGSEFTAGDSKQFEHAKITFRHYYDEEMQPVVGDSKATVDNSNILNSPPTLNLNRKILVQIKPEQRIRRVTLNWAQNTGTDNNQIMNFGVNGEFKSWRGTLVEKNGKKLGKKKFGGLVNVSVTQQPHGDGNWVVGTLELESDPNSANQPNRGIGRFGVGGSSQVHIDNICLETF